MREGRITEQKDGFGLCEVQGLNQAKEKKTSAGRGYWVARRCEESYGTDCKRRIWDIRLIVSFFFLFSISIGGRCFLALFLDSICISALDILLHLHSEDTHDFRALRVQWSSIHQCFQWPLTS